MYTHGTVYFRILALLPAGTTGLKIEQDTIWAKSKNNARGIVSSYTIFPIHKISQSHIQTTSQLSNPWHLTIFLPPRDRKRVKTKVVPQRGHKRSETVWEQRTRNDTVNTLPILCLIHYGLIQYQTGTTYVRFLCVSTLKTVWLVVNPFPKCFKFLK